MKYISIILPCYNVEEYISSCLESILNQDLSHDTYEIICVNDCSPDGVSDVINAYRKRYNDIHLIEHKINKRQGGARNTALRVAQGEYIWFVDPDDTIKSGSLSELYKLCKEKCLDTLLFNFNKTDLDGRLIETSSFSSDTDVYNGIDYVKNVWGINFLNRYDGSVWNRIYRREFLLERSIFFSENMYWEDFDHSLKTILYADRVMSTKRSYYNYRVNPNSVMNTLNNNTNMIALFDSTIRLGGMLVDFSNQLNFKDKDIADKIREGGIWRLNHFVKQLIKAEWKYKREFNSIVQKNSVSIQYSLLAPLPKVILKCSITLYLLQIITLVRKGLK